LSIAMSALRRRLAGSEASALAVQALGTMQRDTAALAEEVRHVSHDLHPAALQHTGLVVAVQGLCAQFEKVQEIPVTYRADDLGIVDAGIALGLYRITQEALHNVAKHAAAHRVDVSLSRSLEEIQLSIIDDGTGFDPGRPRGLGLVSIDERARMLGGTMEIKARPEGGTRVEVRIPAAT